MTVPSNTLLRASTDKHKRPRILTRVHIHKPTSMHYKREWLNAKHPSKVLINSIVNISREYIIHFDLLLTFRKTIIKFYNLALILQTPWNKLKGIFLWLWWEHDSTVRIHPWNTLHDYSHCKCCVCFAIVNFQVNIRIYNQTKQNELFLPFMHL